MEIEPKKILVIYQDHSDNKQNRITQNFHLHALEASETPHEIVYFNTADTAPTWYNQHAPTSPPDWLRTQEFDVIILNYQLLGYKTIGAFFYEWKHHFDWIRDLKGLKIAIPQDEFDCAGILDEWLFDWGVSIIFTINGDSIDQLYPIMHGKAAFYHCLPGYINERILSKYAASVKPISERPNDIVYRARKLAYYFGSYSQYKYRLPDIIYPYAEKLGLTCDFSTRIEDTVYGEKWFDFLASSKATIGCEGGASAINARNEIRITEEMLREKNPSLTFEDFKARMSPDWDCHRFLSITPRVFENAVTKTCQILVEGEYNGIIKPDIHYIPLKRDMSNIDEALEKLKNTEFIQNMVDRTYEDICRNDTYTYRAFARSIEQAILEHER